MGSIKRFEVRLSGTGGQGLVTAGIILAQAAVLDGKNAVQTQVYGPESRGGACRSEVIISDRAIDYPQVTNPDLCLVMSQESYDLFAPDVRKGGSLIVDSTLIEENLSLDGVHIYSSPITRIVKERLESIVVANMTALSFLNEVTGLVRQEHLLEAIISRVPVKYADLNKKAFELGRELGQEIMAGKT